MLVCPGGPELGKTNRHEVASYEIASNPKISADKIPGCTRNVLHHGDRRGRMSECLFWILTTTPEEGPDLDLPTRRTLVQSGMPACELEEWPEETEYLARVRATAQSIKRNLNPDQGWFQQFSRDMQKADPGWTWQGEYTIHRGLVQGQQQGVLPPETCHERLKTAMCVWQAEVEAVARLE